jgi:hypothetical protein
LHPLFDRPAGPGRAPEQRGANSVLPPEHSPGPLVRKGRKARPRPPGVIHLTSVVADGSLAGLGAMPAVTARLVNNTL